MLAVWANCAQDKSVKVRKSEDMAGDNQVAPVLTAREAAGPFIFTAAR